jgi:hypothetical protein
MCIRMYVVLLQKPTIQLFFRNRPGTDFKNIFAENFAEKNCENWLFRLKTKLNYANFLS